MQVVHSRTGLRLRVCNAALMLLRSISCILFAVVENRRSGLGVTLHCLTPPSLATPSWCACWPSFEPKFWKRYNLVSMFSVVLHLLK